LPPQEIFLSHSDRDRTFVVRLAETLRRHGLPVWYSNTDIVGAQQWHDEIGSAPRGCDWFVLVQSPSAVNSIWVKREPLFALQQNRLDESIVPLMFKSCDYEDSPGRCQAFR
jgi:hypothetical protein